MRKIKKGDNVVVIAGRDKGKRGDVKATVGDEHVLVAGVNQVKKHTRPNPQKNIQGGILERESPIRVDKLQLICPSCGEPARTGSHRTAEGGVRFCKKCKAEVGK